MQKVFTRIAAIILLSALILPACSTPATPPPVPTDTPQPTATVTATPTQTPKPTSTPRPTNTPNLAATQRMSDLQAEAQKYADLGYIPSAKGNFQEYDDFQYDWAQLGWYKRFLLGQTVKDFFISAHVNWKSAYKNADESGCGIAFANQENGEHYAIFLDRSKLLFVDADKRYNGARLIGPTRGTGRVKFTPPAEADLTLIVNNGYAYVLVDGEVVGEYTLSQSRNLEGDLALTVLSGTNKDYGTHCEMTNIHTWTPE